MADQEFQINIKTLADLTGIKLTQQQLDALQTAAKQGNVQAINAMKQLSDAQKQAQANMNVGLTGSTVGLGTLIYMLNFAVHKWAQFSAEQDRWVESAIRAEEKARALGESILDMQDAARSAARVDNEPLEQSYIRLQQEIIRLKTEQNLLNLPEQGEEWKKLNAEIHATEGLLHKVTSALQQQKDAADKLAEKRTKDEESFMANAVKSSSLQVQRTLQQEEAARRTGDEAYLRSAEAFKRGFTPEQAQEYEQLKGAGSQKLLDAINELRQENERQHKEVMNIWR